MSYVQVFVGGSLIGGSDDLLQLVADKQLHKLLHEAQGKTALPKDLQAAVETASSSSDASTVAAFIPEGFTRDEYNRLQQLVASMEEADHAIQW